MTKTGVSMNDLIIQSPSPLLDTGITVRPGMLADVPFMDKLQKLHTREVGWMPTAQFEGKIKLGHVLVAESAGTPVGYVLGNDQYFKRDDLGIIYQVNVAPTRHRGLVGATLLRAQFERSAYGCKLYCCWCAQDIEANRFWEAMGFVPLAFRVGSKTRGKGGTPRVHIFWQKRINQGDDVTPWWFPSKTDGGALRADRIVLPIPVGTHWSEVVPVAMPGEEAAKALPAARRSAAKKAKPVEARRTVRSNGMSFDVPKPGVTPAAETAVVRAEPKAKREKVKSDPALVAFARELRDRWLERVNETPLLGVEKYAVSRAMTGTANQVAPTLPTAQRLLAA